MSSTEADNGRQDRCRWKERKIQQKEGTNQTQGPENPIHVVGVVPKTGDFGVCVKV